MSDLPFLQIIGYSIGILGQLLVAIACIVLFVKKKSIATGLMILGILLSTLFYILNPLMLSFAAREGVEYLMEAQGILSVLGSGSDTLCGSG